MRRLLIVAAAVLGVWACGRGSSADTAQGGVDRDTLTRRQKDSIISTMPLPGASGIGRAQGAVDRANARTTAHDTVR